uniref:Cilia and flagella associated protein 57 n=1 Tax=Equus caballus TaxID=9796 RepID=A0A9L0R1A5_HORSE
MSTVVAQSLHVFGLRSHVANNVFFFDEQIIIFPSGNHCVKYNVDQKWQRFIPVSLSLPSPGPLFELSDTVFLSTPPSLQHLLNSCLMKDWRFYPKSQVTMCIM